MAIISLAPSKGRPDYEEKKAAYLKTDRIRATVIWGLMGLGIIILWLVALAAPPFYIDHCTQVCIFWYSVVSTVLLPIGAVHILKFEVPGKSLLSMAIWQLYLIEILAQAIIVFAVLDTVSGDGLLALGLIVMFLGMSLLLAYFSLYVVGMTFAFLKPEMCLLVPSIAVNAALVSGVVYILFSYWLFN